jgi:hypothetical protein
MVKGWQRVLRVRIWWRELTCALFGHVWGHGVAGERGLYRFCKRCAECTRRPW